MTDCIPIAMLDKTIFPIKWTYKNRLAYEEFWKDILNSSKLGPIYLNSQNEEDRWIDMFSLTTMKSVKKRSSENTNAMDMPVVFMPQKSSTDCVAKPKVYHIHTDRIVIISDHFYGAILWQLFPRSPYKFLFKAGKCEVESSPRTEIECSRK